MSIFIERVEFQLLEIQCNLKVAYYTHFQFL
jgi:hypothetical protein